MKSLTLIASLCLVLSLVTAHKVVKGWGDGRPGVPASLDSGVRGRLSEAYGAIRGEKPVSVWLIEGPVTIASGEVECLDGRFLFEGQQINDQIVMTSEPVWILLPDGTETQVHQNSIIGVADIDEAVETADPPEFAMIDSASRLPYRNPDRQNLCQLAPDFCPAGTSAVCDGICVCLGVVPNGAGLFEGRTQDGVIVVMSRRQRSLGCKLPRGGR